MADQRGLFNALETQIRRRGHPSAPFVVPWNQLGVGGNTHEALAALAPLAEHHAPYKVKIDPRYLYDARVRLKPAAQAHGLDDEDAKQILALVLTERHAQGHHSTLWGLSRETGIQPDQLVAVLEALSVHVPSSDKEGLVFSDNQIGELGNILPAAPEAADESVLVQGDIRTQLLARFCRVSTLQKVDASTLPSMTKFENMGYVERLGQNSAYYRLCRRGLEWFRNYRRERAGLYVAGESLSADEEGLLRNAARTFCNELKTLNDTIETMLGENIAEAPRIAGLRRALNYVERGDGLPNFDVVEVLEAAFLACKGEIVKLRAQREALRLKVKDPSLLRKIDTRVEAFDRMLRASGFAQVHGSLRPQITDFVNIGAYQSFLAESGKATFVDRSPRPTDEKFGILNAPASFSADFRQQKAAVFERGRSLAVAFVDIDKFKDVNTRYAEAVVDRDILPPFMRALDAYCYGRARAYRQGGDEYLILLHNADADEAVAFFDGLRRYLAKVRYPEEIESNPTVSVGVHVVAPVNDVTVLEAIELANRAKNRAKDEGRDRCALANADDFHKVTRTLLAGA